MFDIGTRERRLLWDAEKKDAPSPAADATPTVEKGEEPKAPENSKEVNDAYRKRGEERIAEAKKKAEALQKMTAQEQQEDVQAQLDIVKSMEDSEERKEAMKQLQKELQNPGWKVAIDEETMAVESRKPAVAYGEQIRQATSTLSQLETMSADDSENAELKEEVAAMKAQIEKLERKRDAMTVGERIGDDQETARARMNDPSATFFEKIGALFQYVGSYIRQFKAMIFGTLNDRSGPLPAAERKPATGILKDIPDDVEFMENEMKIAGHNIRLSKKNSMIDGREIVFSADIGGKNVSGSPSSVLKQGNKIVITVVGQTKELTEQQFAELLQSLETKGHYDITVKDFPLRVATKDGAPLGKPPSAPPPSPPDNKPPDNAPPLNNDIGYMLPEFQAEVNAGMDTLGISPTERRTMQRFLSRSMANADVYANVSYIPDRPDGTPGTENERIHADVKLDYVGKTPPPGFSDIETTSLSPAERAARDRAHSRAFLQLIEKIKNRAQAPNEPPVPPAAPRSADPEAPPSEVLTDIEKMRKNAQIAYDDKEKYVRKKEGFYDAPEQIARADALLQALDLEIRTRSVLGEPEQTLQSLREQGKQVWLERNRAAVYDLGAQIDRAIERAEHEIRTQEAMKHGRNWFAKLTSGLTGSNPHDIEIAISKQTLFDAKRVKERLLRDAIQEVAKPKALDVDMARVNELTQKIAGHIAIINRPANTAGNWEAHDQAIDATRDASIVVITLPASFVGAGSAASLMGAVRTGAYMGAKAAVLESGARNTDDVQSGKKTVDQAVKDTMVDTGKGLAAGGATGGALNRAGAGISIVGGKIKGALKPNLAPKSGPSAQPTIAPPPSPAASPPPLSAVNPKPASGPAAKPTTAPKPAAAPEPAQSGSKPSPEMKRARWRSSEDVPESQPAAASGMGPQEKTPNPANNVINLVDEVVDLKTLPAVDTFQGSLASMRRGVSVYDDALKSNLDNLIGDFPGDGAALKAMRQSMGIRHALREAYQFGRFSPACRVKLKKLVDAANTRDQLRNMMDRNIERGARELTINGETFTQGGYFPTDRSGKSLGDVEFIGPGGKSKIFSVEEVYDLARSQGISL